ncbi:MAG TPA: hypothetical protein VLF67_01980, partial [Candidatus Saccharimonas sp.]|nr:hypothetical protein [Candidatus Saccharimonas sp.]
MKKLLILIIIPVLATIAISAASLLLPQPPGAADGAYYNPLGTSITLIDMGLSISAGILFFRARRNFKPELRPAYRFLAAATLATGILNIDFPITEYYSLWSNFYFDAASYLPYFAGGILMFLGMRQFYRFINTGQRTWVTNIPLLLAITIVVWALYVLNTHLINAWGSEAQHDWMQIVVLVPVTGYAAACYMALRTWSRLGHAYRLALGWLTIALLAYTFDVTMVLVQEIIGNVNWFFN